jgi:asparagine synthase (glutamine-hydrolysing)
MINIKITVSSKFDKISIENIKYNIYLKTSNNKNANNEKLLSFISKQGIDRKKIIRFCLNNFNFFSIIIWNKQFLLAVSDQVSSYQLIYKKDKYNIQISDNINFFKNEKLNENSIKQIEYSGYTIDNYTVFKNVYGLKPYEYIFKNKRISEQKFYKKISITYKTKSNSRLLEKNLTRLLFNIFNEIKNKNKNNKIFVPLSAGYDSRAILSLLIEVGCKNLETFTYGRKNVRDFVIAKKFQKN